MLTRNEITCGGDAGIAFLLQDSQRIRVHPTFVDDLVQKARLVLQIVGGCKHGHVVRVLAACTRGDVLGGNPPGLNSFHDRLGNGVRVVADVVLDMGAILTNVVCPDGAAVLEVDYLRWRAHHGQGQQEARKQEEGDRCPH